MKVTKAVFPVAGLGTRFLPATKANPKEMLAIVDKPLIQYAVEEAISSGIRELIFVTSSGKRAIEDHFDADHALEQHLLKQGKTKDLALVKNIIPKGVECIYVRQAQPLGLGHAILCAKAVVGENPFAVLLADDLICATPPCLQQMLAVFQQHQRSVVAVQKIAPHDCDKHGVIAVNPGWKKQGNIQAIVEKPSPEKAPSSYGVVGRYILTAKIFTYLAKLPPTHQEIQLTDAMAQLLNEEAVMALQFEGKRYDCGSKLGYLQAITALALQHPEWGGRFKQYLQQLIHEHEMA